MNALIADKFEDAGAAALKELGLKVTIDPSLKDDALAAAVRDTQCDILVVRSTKVNRAAFTEPGKPALVLRAGSGYDTIDVAAASENGTRVCNCPGMNAVAVAELTIGLMIALDRRIVDQTDDLRRGVWNKKEYGKARGLKGRTLGIVGLGRIGAEVARRAAAFEMQLIYSDVVAMPALEREYGLRRVQFDRLLADADFVTVHVPGGGETKHLIGAKQLRTMKPTAFVLNCSRGGVIDEKALTEAVESRTIAGAALDVYEIEPGATETQFSDPVVNTGRIYGTHHVGASTDQAQLAVADEAVRVIRAFVESGTFLNCVNPVETAAHR